MPGRIAQSVICSLLALQLLLPAVATLAEADTEQAANAGAVLFQLDFGNDEGLSPRAWLERHGFELHRDAGKEGHIEVSHRDGLLHVVAKRPSFGLVARPLNAPQAGALRLHWGVSDYPEGASYEHGVDNEAIMIYVFFGEEKLDSGEMLVPDSPYFVGFYLCPPDGDRLDTPFVGHHYKKTGRYECVDHPGEGRAVVSEIRLDVEFARSFGLDAMPPISGFSIEVDTTDSANDGHAAAFLDRLEFVE
jgi:hypothetical protein